MFDKVKAMFRSATDKSTLDTALREDKNVFFLHLLGLDTTGHAYRPYSKEYLHNIKVVDQGVEEITKLVEEFYGDDQTAFVFTADHGMSDWGSHGDGHPDNTRTPLIAWGSGIAKPVISRAAKAPGHEDGFSADWGLDHVQRHDVAQADIAALMAYVAGLEFPVNSVGELPLTYIAGDQKEKADAAFVNAQGIMEMYRVKEEQKRSIELRYRSYAPLGGEQNSVEHRVADIRRLIEAEQYTEAIRKSQDLLTLGLQGLRYLQTYDWLFLRALVTAGYLGWIAFAVITVLDLHVLHGKTETSRNMFTITIFSALAVAIFSVLWVQKSPVTYYAYAAFPLVFWEEVIARRGALVAGKNALFANSESKHETGSLVVGALAFAVLLEALVSICPFPRRLILCPPRTERLILALLGTIVHPS